MTNNKITSFLLELLKQNASDILITYQHDAEAKIKRYQVSYMVEDKRVPLLEYSGKIEYSGHINKIESFVRQVREYVYALSNGKISKKSGEREEDILNIPSTNINFRILFTPDGTKEYDSIVIRFLRPFEVGNQERKLIEEKELGKSSTELQSVVYEAMGKGMSKEDARLK